ncbi:NuoI/complex I 23 kDa subunit family protein [Dehalobacterium formicoaceticum]|uniref:NADH-quinone oxidoreductase subunit I n=1 Tax=Dehalobacterium formicoaceticum TaxID=51515 RepID=A0ABT1Y9A1_9FIRM|nr:NADH-quinone oxidoreductase subunit I [Dehalobacterium formicoaceticum]MCR6546236.1 NADH-quinone oxidoreductase subunit I [Dehalobacterium formicoaceticum]
MNGEGLLKGLGVTFKHYVAPKVTQEYPEVKPNLPPAVKSRFRIDPEKCISCGMCVRACPNEVITLTSEKDENNKKVLTEYIMNLQYCLFCGLCEEICPTDAIAADQNFELAAYTRDNTKNIMYRKYPAGTSAVTPKAPTEEDAEDKGGDAS